MSTAKLLIFSLVLIAVGGFVGLYFQPPGLQKVMTTLGLDPGGGTSTPIAVAVPEPEASGANSQSTSPGVVTSLPTGVSTVVGLGRLEPRGAVSTIAPPAGSGDARLAKILVAEGDTVAEGELLAVLDNRRRLESAVDTARSIVALREADLSNRRITVQSNAAEARASLESAKAAAVNAQLDFDRYQRLFERQIVARAAVDVRRASLEQAQRAVEQAQAKLDRYTDDLEKQSEVVVARATLESAKAELRSAIENLSQSEIVSPLDGTVLDIISRVGERPSSEGVMTVGNVSEMIATVEIYQSQIGAVSVNDEVVLTADALNGALNGKVSRIGIEVKRQTLIGSDPAANTDARVVEVEVALDQASSEIASRLTNLQVQAVIKTDDEK